MMIRVFFCLLMSSQLQASSKLDFNEIKLKKMAQVMNARDFDLMLNSLRQLEVLDLACQKEKQRQAIPITCLELAEKLKESGVKIEPKLNEIATICSTRLSDISDADIENLAKKQHLLKGHCRNDVLERAKILSYKKSGKRFE